VEEVRMVPLRSHFFFRKEVVFIHSQWRRKSNHMGRTMLVRAKERRFNMSCRSKSLMALSVTILMLLILAIGSTSFARVARIEIIERVPFAGGMEFGKVGAYEKIKGKLHYAVDPDNRYNKQIVDLQLAKEGRLRTDASIVYPDRIEEIVGGDARNSAGEVTFSGDFILLKPVDLKKGNHRLFYDVNNRGRPLALGYYNNAPSSNDPTTAEDAGNGWLMREGYSILWSGWNWDVERPTENPLRIFLPIVVNEDGSPLVEWINAEITVQDRDGVKVDWIAWGGSRCYAVTDDPVLQQQAILTVRDLPDVDSIGPRTLVPREDWDFAVLDSNGSPVFDPVHVYYPAGFEKGRIYELLYWAKNPRVVGLGLAGIRDAISFFHFETEDDHGNPNPLSVGHGKKLRVDPEFAYIFGISQSGRVTTHMIYQGFHVDEKGRMVFEGARPHVCGGGKGSFNYRWAQTTHHPKHIEANYFAADYFPFNFTPDGVWQFDPYRVRDGQYGDVLAVAKALNKIPKIMLGNHELEYWTRAGSLVHTNVQGTEDVTPHENVRFYMVNGSPHGNPSTTSRRILRTDEHARGYVDQRPVGRALLVALDRWVTYGIEPPPTTVPRLDEGELVTVTRHKADFPQIPAYSYGDVNFPALRHPGTYLKPPRADYGPRFFMPMPWPGKRHPRTCLKPPWRDCGPSFFKPMPWPGGIVPVPYPGIQDNVPPEYFGPPYETRVPYFDSNGNGIGGIRLPDLTVPLGTYQGWNPRKTGTGAENFLTAFDDSFWPFPLTEAERIAKNDPRPSIEALYPTQKDYVEKVKKAAHRLRRDRFLLREDELAIVDFAEKMVWPPEPTDLYPFWKMQE
jgi:hypothetical protein